VQGTLQALGSIARADGARGLFRGLGPTVRVSVAQGAAVQGGLSRGCMSGSQYTSRTCMLAVVGARNTHQHHSSRCAVAGAPGPGTSGPTLCSCPARQHRDLHSGTHQVQTPLTSLSMRRALPSAARRAGASRGRRARRPREC
jgi:hypothetical protein